MSDLVQLASDVLREMYDPDSGQFSETTSVVDGSYVNCFSVDPGVRYTANCLLGLARAAAAGSRSWDVGCAFDAFLARSGHLVVNPGDEALLLWALTEAGHDDAGRWAARAVARTDDVLLGPKTLPLQEMCWMLSGLSRCASVAGGTDAARSLFDTLRTSYADEESGFPLQSPRGWRSTLVSFGGVTYFLRALWDYFDVTGDGHALDLFRALAGRVIAQQASYGEWPWLYDARSGRAVERYQVYSVHQEAMSMLFLLPAVALGLPGADAAVRKSYRWVLGDNELGRPLWRAEPFLVYRSIRRAVPWSGPAAGSTRHLRHLMDRGSNLAHAATRIALRQPATPARQGAVEINPECRSYEMGWTVYVWAGVKGFEEFTDAAWVAVRDGCPA